MIPRRARHWRLEGLAQALGLPFRGDPGVLVRAAADLSGAGAFDLAALFDGRRKGDALASSALALIVPEGLAADFAGRHLLLSRFPRADFARAIDLLHPEVRPAAGLHPSVQVGSGVVLGQGIWAGAGVLIGDGCRIGDGARIGPGCVLLDEVDLAEEVVLHPRVVLYPRTVIGARSVVLAGAVIGAPGFGFAPGPAGPVRVPHLGRVVIEEDVEIGANTTIDRATFGETRIGARTKLDNLVQVAHNVTVGPEVMIAAQSGLSGSCTLGQGVVVGGQSGVADHIAVGRGSLVAAKTAVFGDVAPGEAVAGIPACPAARWRRITALEQRLPQIWKTLRGLAQGRGGNRE